MKKMICFLFFVSFALTRVTAQIHLKGQRFYSMQAGLTDDFHFASSQLGINVIAGTGVYNRKYNAWKASLSVVQKALPAVGLEPSSLVRQFGAGYGYEFNLWRSPMRTRFIRGVVQPILLYESVEVKPITPDSTRSRQGNSRLLLGGDVGFDIELSPLEVSIRQRWQPNSVIQPFHILFSVGWRFHQ